MSAPSSPQPDHDDPSSLDQLIGYFVAAKKSLSATSHVYRANEMVEDARSLIEEGAILKAKNTYVRNGAQEQVHILSNINGGLEAVGLEAQLDFQEVIKSLDLANDRLQATLASLRSTIVSATLGASQDLSTPTEPAPKDKTLFDFIDESTHTDLLDSLRDTIDEYNSAQATLHKVRQTLSSSLDSLNTRLSPLDTPPASDPHSLSDAFTSLTSNASEMASLLQSLISHYDLCITALKHTEGGSDAALAARSAISPDPASATEASLYAPAADRAPISADEREEMLSVLATDASQVSDVVLELSEREEEMSTVLSQITESTQTARTKGQVLTEIVGDLAQLAKDQLPNCVASSTAFRGTWAALRATLVDRTTALGELAGFYDAFLASYAALLREVDRRAMVEAKMRKIAERAARDLDALAAEDKDMRDQFLREVGDWLPRDIWPGLTDAPRQWDVVRRKAGE